MDLAGKKPHGTWLDGEAEHRDANPEPHDDKKNGQDHPALHGEALVPCESARGQCGQSANFGERAAALRSGYSGQSTNTPRQSYTDRNRPSGANMDEADWNFTEQQA